MKLSFGLRFIHEDENDRTPIAYKTPNKNYTQNEEKQNNRLFLNSVSLWKELEILLHAKVQNIRSRLPRKCEQEFNNPFLHDRSHWIEIDIVDNRLR